MARTQRAFGVEATPREVELRVNVGRSIEAALKSKHPPTLPFYHFLAQRDVVGIAVAMLVPSGLSGVIPFTSERLLAFRLAHLLRAIPVEQTAAVVVSVDIEGLVRKPYAGHLRTLQRDFTDEMVHGHVKWPQRGVFNGRAYENRIDIPGVFFWMFEKEIKAKLIGEALADHNPAEAMQMSERRENYTALEVERMRLTRLLEFWWRRCEEDGVTVERTWTFEPMAFLGIEPV